MALDWEDRGNGQWKLTITDDTGTQPPAIVTGTKDQILEKLANSKINGDRRISELRNGLTPTERMQTVAELANPATVDKAITRVVERAVGPLEDLRTNSQEERQERETRQAIAAAQAFADETPGWYPSEHNKKTLVNRMKLLGLSPSNRQHYTQAFEELNAAGLLQARPDEENDNLEPEDQPATERTAPTPAARPRTPSRISTGVRQRDVSGEPPRPGTTVRLKYTREQLAKMGTAEYKRLLMSDRAELEKCEAYYASHPARRAS